MGRREGGVVGWTERRVVGGQREGSGRERGKCSGRERGRGSGREREG